MRRALLWRFVDAAIPACFAGPAEVLLLFLLSPDRPLTIGDFAAATLAMLPQVVLLFGLLGPALVVIGHLLRVGKTTRRGVSVRYVLRFALLDACLLLVASAYQWHAVGSLLPGPGRVALALMITSLGFTAVLLALMAVIDMKRPRVVGAPWLAAVGLGLAIALTAAAQVRRVHPRPPEPRPLPGFAVERPLLVIEIPGLAPSDLEDYIERGLLPEVEALARTGVQVRVRGGELSDSIALHANLITGRPATGHRLLGAVRYKPFGDRRSFAVVPRALFIRPLLRTPLWRRVPVDHESLYVMALPGIARSLGLNLAWLGDPLGWPRTGALDWMVAETDLQEGELLPVPEGAPAVRCPAGDRVSASLFDPPAPELPATPRLEALVRRALTEDLCALSAARRAVAAETYSIVYVRLPGYYEVAYQFAGWRAGDPARSVAERELEAYGRVMPRYAREIGPALGALMEAGAAHESLIALVSPHGIRAREDLSQVTDALLGRMGPTGTHAGPPDGTLVLVGEGVKAGVNEGAVNATSVLPTLLWAVGLPPSEAMGPIAFRLFEGEFARRTPVVTVPTYELE